MNVSAGQTIASDQRELLESVGYDELNRAGMSLIVDHEVVSALSMHPDVEVLSLRDALQKHDWLQDLMFGLIDPDLNDHVRQAAELIHDPVGYFVHVRHGAKVSLPIQLFTIMDTAQARQFTHNITVIEPGAQVEIVSGSAVPSHVHAGHHVSIDECYIGEGATYRSVSVEQWGKNMVTHGYSRTKLAPDAVMTSLSIQLGPIKQHRSESVSYLDDRSRMKELSVVLAPPGTDRWIETTVELNGVGSASESITRMVAAGGNITNKSTLAGSGENSKGFLGCDGLKLDDEGEIFSVPALRAVASSSQLSHEASVGMIAVEKLEYLMAAGLGEEDARDLIVQGFLNLETEMLPDAVAGLVREAVHTAKSGFM